MAKVIFRSAEDEEQNVRLVQHRPTRVGRDPANDVILRDAKVSRTHAEIVFEKGFFVIHDLASANGTWVNGRKIRIAPLTDGAEIRLGNTILTFSEELPQQPESTVASELPLGEAVVHGSVADLADPVEELGAEEEIETPVTRPLPIDPRSRNSSPQDHVPPALPVTVIEPPKRTEPDRLQVRTGPGDTPVVTRPTPVAQPAATLFRQQAYRIDFAPPGEVAAIRGEEGEPLLYFKRSTSLVGTVAAVLAGMVAVSGLAATTFLALEMRLLPSAAALLLTVVFAYLLSSLVPKRYVALYRQEMLTGKVMTIAQESRSLFPQARFSARSEDGRAIAFFEKSAIGHLFGKRRWWIIDASSSAALGHATKKHNREDVITVGVRPAASILRADDGGTALDLSADSVGTLDRRIALSVALLVSGRLR